MGKNTKIVGGILLVAIILVAVAYAAITNVELNINGVGNAQAKQENFKVEFIGTPSTSGKGTTTATISSDDKTQGSVNVTGLTAKGDEAVATSKFRYISRLNSRSNKFKSNLFRGNLFTRKNNIKSTRRNHIKSNSKITKNTNR